MPLVRTLGFRIIALESCSRPSPSVSVFCGLSFLAWVDCCNQAITLTEHSPNLTLKANKRPSWNPNQQTARYTERMFMPRPDLVLVARFKIPAESVLTGRPKHKV